jgi:hypothetical protein
MLQRGAESYGTEERDKCVLLSLDEMRATVDGCAVNRKLIKIHQESSGLQHKVLNPFASDGRYIHFFSDPPHLLKQHETAWHPNAEIYGYGV